MYCDIQKTHFKSRYDISKAFLSNNRIYGNVVLGLIYGSQPKLFISLSKEI